MPHHGLDVVDPGERYSAGRFAREAAGWIAEVRARRQLPVVVGGTGLYIRALVDGLFVEPPLDPERRRELEHWVGGLAAGELVRWAARLDPGFAGGGRQRATRAIEIALLTGQPLSHWQLARPRPRAPSTPGTCGSPRRGRCCTSGSRCAPRRWCGGA